MNHLSAFVLLSLAAGTMLPRNMRTGGYDLPGVESTDVPLIGYRPLQPDSPGNQSRRGSGVDEWETSQVSVFPRRLVGTRPSSCYSSGVQRCDEQKSRSTRCVRLSPARAMKRCDRADTRSGGLYSSRRSWGGTQLRSIRPVLCESSPATGCINKQQMCSSGYRGKQNNLREGRQCDTDRKRSVNKINSTPAQHRHSC